MKIIREDLTFEGQELSLQTGRYAKQADGSVWCQYGGTVLLATVVSGTDEITEERDFFPLTVDYIEKFYAAGRYPGGFLKRETQPSVGEKLTARLIDRPIRPLFPKWFQNDTHVMITVLSYDEAADPKIMAVTAASAALSISNIPFAGPIAAVRVIKKDGELIINPSHEQVAETELNIVLAASKDSIVMVEGEAKEASEDEIMEVLTLGHEAIQHLLVAQNALVAKIKPVKRGETKLVADANLADFMRKVAMDPIAKAVAIKEKLVRYAALGAAKKVAVAQVKEAIVAEKADFLDMTSFSVVEKRAKKIFSALVGEYLRSLIVEKNIRIDGRDLLTVRPIEIDAGVLPKVHGSSVFSRGETQSLGTVTLGVKADEQRVDTMTDVDRRRFMLHYNFPPFSVGEAGRLRPAGRRELGHGTLAERALQAVIPSAEDFEYTIRVVSEILESNGSSSMASVCSGCIAMMDAGVPIKKHVAGIAMGLIKNDEDYIILTDILGDE
ncbi:polyribonucleotide nucleotidyltransferase, partial [bacterium]|nr:polyribonucleotide nucleotidyltransferase [bacterium]